MQFVFLKSEDKLTSDEIDDIRKNFCETTSVVCENTQYEWVSSDSKAFFIGRNPNVTIYEKYQTFDVNQNNDLAFINGWLKKSDEDYLLDAKKVHNLDCEDLDGLFLYGKFNSHGSGEIKTSLLIPNLYYAKSEGKFAISNRISTLSKIFNYTSFNKKHFASHVHYLTTFITNDTLYENIYCIPLGSKITISDDLILERTIDIFYNEELEKKYLEDREKYWDECYRRILSQVHAFDNLGINDKLKVGISGGIDSRLLLSIYHKSIDSTFTWGPTYSPEVIVGKMCADKVGLIHNKQNIRGAQSTKNFLNFFPEHIFTRELEMSPWDFGPMHYDTLDTITVDGQEFLKTPPFDKEITREEIIEENEKKFLWRKGIVPDEYLSVMTDEHRNHIIEVLDNIHNIQKFPFMERILRRGRWVGRVQETIFEQSFNIYPLITNTFLTYVYNSSVESMLNKEFIYEIISRSTPELLEVPFYNASYFQKDIPLVENKIPGKTSYRYEFLIKYFDYLKEFALEHHHLIEDFVKMDYLDNLTLERLEDMKNRNDPSLPQSFYNVLESIVIFKVNDFPLLKNNFDYDWEVVDESSQSDVNQSDVEEKKNIFDTPALRHTDYYKVFEMVDEEPETLNSFLKELMEYDEDCLTAFVEYNKDIVNYKKEIIQYKKEIANYKKESSKLVRFNSSRVKNKLKRMAKKVLK